MKYLLISVALLAANPASALDFCKTLGDLAETVMQKRQDGATMSVMISVSETSPYSELSRRLIIGAFEVPQFATRKVQAEAVVDYRNEVELSCYQ